MDERFASSRATQLLRIRLEQERGPSVESWRGPAGRLEAELAHDVVVETGWGRLHFGHTFRDQSALCRGLLGEREGQRDIALYLRDPHVVLSLAPQDLFLDPSHTYRLLLSHYRHGARPAKAFVIRRVVCRADVVAMNRLYAQRRMVPVDVDFVVARRHSRVLTHLVAEDVASGEIIGTVTGVDHEHAFGDPEGGSSLWCLAVDSQAGLPGVGEMLVRQLAEHYCTRGRAFMDLSVMHDNAQAIALYEKLGFRRVPAFCLKRKNTINERLFLGPEPHGQLNPYARIIADEARRRGIAVEVVDEETNLLSLGYGGRTIRCRESLSELTSSVALQICDDKRLCWRLVRRAGVCVPAQRIAGTREVDEAFLRKWGRVVVKPARGEQGHGVSVDVRTPAALSAAIARARVHDDTVLIEELVEGEDLRIVVIGGQVVAAAVRRPARIVGTGHHTVRQLVQAQSRRRAAATGGESRIPEDEETERCLRQQGVDWAHVPAEGEAIDVRRTANLHTGGTIHDVTDRISPVLADAARLAARVIGIPVVGFDFIVPNVEGDTYAFIEANERPGLANHEPQPTAERFVDLLFPHTGGARGRGAS
jgi:GNAT-family acetyltransferase (TIGR03103 family)